MKKIKFAIASLGIFLMFSLTAYAAERANPEFDNRHWKLGWSQNNGEEIFEEALVGFQGLILQSGPKISTHSLDHLKNKDLKDD